ncbi:MAG: glycosyltransferase family 2 protein, partial [Gemmatimonadales bacterium]|nr:glycosyltransferase family 2 protein [Gemmatimonadales bacterium]
VFVVGEAGDPGLAVAAELGCIVVEAPRRSVTAKVNAALHDIDVDLVLIAGDDDIQDPRRLAAACAAYDAGRPWTSSSVLTFRRTADGREARYEGPPELVGTCTSIARDVALAVDGWPDVARGMDGAMAARLRAEGYRCHDLRLDRTVALEHGRNLNAGRPFPEPGQAARSGPFGVVGLTVAAAAENAKRVSVVISAYRAEQWIVECVDSILTSRLPARWSLEVVIAVDGCDATWQAVSERYGRHPLVGLLRLGDNVGCYMATNTAIDHSVGDWFTQVGADDTLHPDYLRKMCEAADRDPDLGMINTWARLDMRLMGQTPAFRDVEITGAGGWCWRRDLWDRHIGGHEPWRFGADMETVYRARALGFREYVVREHLYIARKHPGSLTKHPEYGSHTPARRRTWEVIREREAVWAAGEVPRLMTPETGEVVERSGELWSRTVACMATIPGRADILPDVVVSLVDQIDLLCVYLNGHDDVPECLQRPDVLVARSQEHGDRGDAGKFWWIDKPETEGAVILTVDDDIIYPSDYAVRMVRALGELGRGAVVTVHGCDFVSPIESFNTSRRSGPLHCMNALDRMTPVHLVGTGTAAFHRETVRMTPDDFRRPNMADVWFGRYTQRNRVPCYAVDRPKGWLKPFHLTKMGRETIYRRSVGQDEIQTELVQEVAPWTHHKVADGERFHAADGTLWRALRPGVVAPPFSQAPSIASAPDGLRVGVAMPAWQRHDLTAVALDALLAQRRRPDRVVLVTSDDPALEEVANRAGVECINVPNRPLSDKFLAGLKYLGDCDLLFLVGSDDILTPGALGHVAALFADPNVVIAGLEDFFTVEPRCVAYFEGYGDLRPDPIGPCRGVRRSALEAAGWDFGGPRDSGIDGSSARAIMAANPGGRMVRVRGAADAALLAVKLGQSITTVRGLFKTGMVPCRTDDVHYFLASRVGHDMARRVEGLL